MAKIKEDDMNELRGLVEQLAARIEQLEQQTRSYQPDYDRPKAFSRGQGGGGVYVRRRDAVCQSCYRRGHFSWECNAPLNGMERSDRGSHWAHRLTNALCP